MAVEKNKYKTTTVYGRGIERLNQTVTAIGAEASNPYAEIAESLGKVYFQWDRLGSALFTSDNSGGIVTYAEYDTWGNLKTPAITGMNMAGLENVNHFTNYTYDAVIEKYYAQYRFYDAVNSRMISEDPIKAGSNWYVYCSGNPVNFIDPLGLDAHMDEQVGGGFTGSLNGHSNNTKSPSQSSNNNLLTGSKPLAPKKFTIR